MSGITKTIPQKHGEPYATMLYDGSIKEFEFHMAGSPSKLKIGEYVYTIWENMLIGRCQITRFQEGAVNPDSGKPRTLIFVKCPGERLKNPISRKGHRGTRYYDGADWPK